MSINFFERLCQYMSQYMREKYISIDFVFLPNFKKGIWLLENDSFVRIDVSSHIFKQSNSFSTLNRNLYKFWKLFSRVSNFLLKKGKRTGKSLRYFVQFLHKNDKTMLRIFKICLFHHSRNRNFEKNEK